MREHGSKCKECQCFTCLRVDHPDDDIACVTSRTKAKFYCNFVCEGEGRSVYYQCYRYIPKDQETVK